MKEEGWNYVFFFNKWCTLIQGCSAYPTTERCRDRGGCNHSGAQDWQTGWEKKQQTKKHKRPLRHMSSITLIHNSFLSINCLP